MSEKDTAVRKIDEQAGGKKSSVSCPQNSLLNSDSTIKPLLVLKPNHEWQFLLAIVMACIAVFSVFGVIIPFSSSLSLQSIWPSSDNRLFVKMILLISAIAVIAGTPYIYNIVKIKYISYMQDFIIIENYFFVDKKIIHYKYINFNQNSNTKIVLTDSRRSKIYNAFFPILIISVLENKLYSINDTNKAIEILKAKANIATQINLS